MKRLLNKDVEIIWTDSYGVKSGWQDISEYTAKRLIIHSFGKIIYEDTDIISLAHNYAEETDNTTRQANGIMVIPKACIIKITSFSCQEFVSRQKQLTS